MRSNRPDLAKERSERGFVSITSGENIIKRRTSVKESLYVIDGHALCYRAYFAFIRNPLINSQGQNTSAIFGFTRMLLKLISEQKPDYLVVAFDPPKKSFRFDLYPEYKANREKMPDDLRSQIDEIKHMVTTLGIPRLEHNDFEADDILGTITKKYGAEDLEVVLVTGDKDAFQLVDDHTKIYANKKGITEFELYDAKKVKEKLGIPPEQVIDFMALTGDTSDNVPGVRGVGEKTALKLISEYKTLEDLYEHIDEIQGKIRENLKSDRDTAFLSRDLVTIRTDVPLEIDLPEAKTPDMRTEAVKEYFEKLEMKSIVEEIFKEEEAESAQQEKRQPKDYRIIRTEEELNSVLERIEKHGEVSIDTETTSIHPVDAELVGISLSIKEKAGWYIPLCGGSLHDVEHLDRNISLALLKPLLENPDIKKIGQNIKYDTIVLTNAGITLRGIWFDTMVASYLLNPADRRHNLNDMAERYLGYKTIHFDEIVGKGKKAIPITDVPLDDLAEYAIEDADITYRLYQILSPKIRDEGLGTLFRDIEMPLVPLLAQIELNGVKIDVAYFKRLAKENQKMLSHVEEEVYQVAGRRFNINSTRELAEVLFNEIGLTPVKKTKTGYSTDIQVLEALRGKHEIIDHLIQYRTLNKLKTTYIDTLPKLISEKTGRIHTSYNQTIVATGRLSSSDPNLQNIPIRDEFGRKIRKGFIADEGCLLMSADYSQIELRLAAHLSDDENMINAFKAGTDIHNLTASSVFGKPLDEITPDLRRKAKIINFATIYGVSPFGLSQQADISMQEASEFITKYFEAYPGFKKYIDVTVAFAESKGYVTTLLGRKRPIPDINSSISFRKEGAKRVAINTPIQGTAADLIKIAMINIQNKIMEEGYRTKIILQVHDELVFEFPESELATIEKLVRCEMEGALELSVPIVVDIVCGKNWDEAH